MSHPFRNARLELTAALAAQLPPSGASEVAFAGRSNAGKSSALNALADQRRLAFVAKTPGKTRTIQFYRVDEAGFLVDLPGYGYARVSEIQRRQWQGLLERYLATRSSLRGLVLVMDIRHPLTPLDRQMLSWFGPRGLPIHVLLTKCDKISRGVAQSTLMRVRSVLSREFAASTVQLFSSVRRSGLDEARQVISAWLDIEVADRNSAVGRPEK